MASQAALVGNSAMQSSMPPEQSEESGGFLAQVGSAFKSLFGGKKKPEAAAPVEDPNSAQAVNLRMYKKYGIETLCAVDPFREFAEREFSIENLDFIVQVNDRVSKQDIYETFVQANAPNEVNISGSERKAFAELAAAGEYESMDFSSLKKSVLTNVSDTWSRAQFDETMAVAAKAYMGEA